MFFERPETGEVAILVHLAFNNESQAADADELRELAISAGAHPLALISGNGRQINPRYFIGSGKLEEVRDAIRLYEADVVLFNHTLSPSQERNLEQALQCRVLDRTALILDIFAQRARSYEGKLQVELAQCQHTLSRLVRGWTHLDRQKGGIGMRGVGETQLEIDQRLVRQRVKSIEKSLSKVKSQREQSRRARKRAEIATVSLVGYTNAGKSSLFNRLSDSNAFVADRLFATLDSTLRRIDLPEYGACILTDTVGFIRKLPHQLVDAFHATLEETTQATLLLHVVDSNNEQRKQLEMEVNTVLAEIDASDIPTLLVYNKIDLADDQQARLERDDQGRPYRVWVSAKTGAGLDLLRQAISECLADELVEPLLQLTASQGRLRSRLYRQGAVKQESLQQDGTLQLSLRLPRETFIRLMREEGLDPNPLLIHQTGEQLAASHAEPLE